jgi:hypothetical protein
VLDPRDNPVIGGAIGGLVSTSARAESTSWREGFQTLAFDSLAHLPTVPGVYIVVQGEHVLYVGCTANLRARWRWHHRAAQLGAFGPDLVLYWRMASRSAPTRTLLEISMVVSLPKVLDQLRGTRRRIRLI